jgi:putative serine protease PepD
MSNEYPERGQNQDPSDNWSPEPPAAPPTWSPFGFQSAGETPDDTRPFSFGAPAEGPVLPPEAPVAPAAPQAKRARGRSLAAGVVAASLLVGGAAGIGGAALWTSTHDDPAAASSPIITQSGSSAIPAASSDSVVKVAHNLLPSVVKINVSGSDGSGSGSGIIMSADGKILTNNHVASLAGKSGQITIDFNDGTHAPAKVLGTDPLTDTAVIQAEGVTGLTPATIGHSSSLQVGQSVVAIGSPFGLNATVTSGIVSALNRPVDVGQVSQGNQTVYPAIQTDAAINPGNSGGPLVNLAGEVVGIDSAIQTATDTTGGGEPGSIGLGFAIPIDAVLPIVQQMINGETPTHARLGIGVDSAAQTTDGAKVSQVDNGSAGQKAGLKAGDVITKVDDHLISSSDSLIAIVRAYRPGDSVTLTYTRGGSTHTVTATLDSDAQTTSS